MSALQTGIQALDRELDGGFPGGAIVVLMAPPDSPSSRIIHQLMQQRPTTYVTTLRPAADLETEIRSSGNGIMAVDIEEIGEATENNEMLHMLSDSSIYSANISDRDRVLDEANAVFDSIGDTQNVIIDPMNPLENSDETVAYQRFLRAAAAKLRETNSLGVLHCLSRGEPPALREQTLTIADTVWQLDMGTDNEGNLSLETTVPKNRGGKVILEKLNLLVDRNKVYTDLSRGI